MIMTTFELIAGTVIIILSISIIAVVLFQEGKERNMSGVITGGGGESYLNKHKDRAIDTFLVRWTRVIAIGLIAAVILMNVSEDFGWFK